MITLFYLFIYLFICLTDWLVTLLGGGAASAPGVVVPVLLLPQLHFLIQIFLQHIIDESTFTETIPSVLYFFYLCELWWWILEKWGHSILECQPAITAEFTSTCFETRIYSPFLVIINNTPSGENRIQENIIFWQTGDAPLGSSSLPAPTPGLGGSDDGWWCSWESDTWDTTGSRETGERERERGGPGQAHPASRLI